MVLRAGGALILRPNGINLFTAVTHKCSQSARQSVLGRPFVGKAGAYLVRHGSRAPP
jgi:hypothetical protein